MFVCNYDRKKFVDDYRQKYVEITKKCLWIEIADKRLRFLQTKHLQCGSHCMSNPNHGINLQCEYLNKQFLDEDLIAHTYT